MVAGSSPLTQHPSSVGVATGGKSRGLCCRTGGRMYLARFSYDVLPVNRQSAIDFILREVEAARKKSLNARLLVPLTRGLGGCALQFELELARLDQLDQFRERGVETGEETGNWMHSFSEILVAPPAVEILRIAETKQTSIPGSGTPSSMG